MEPETLLADALAAFRITVSPEVRRGLVGYIQMLVRWSRFMNLTAVGEHDLAQRLVAEPLWVARELSPGGRYVDIGSGNGSPAFPWLLTRSFQEADLVEARRRRAVFLRRTAHRLGLGAVAVHPVRFEEFEPSGPADWVTLQGVRLTADLKERIASVFPETRIVWFGGGAELPGGYATRLEIPNSDRCALVFRA